MMKKVLAIDDQKEILLFIKGVFQHYFPNDKFLSTNSGHNGLELAESEEPDAILLDIMMPEIDGYEVCAQLKSNPKTKHIPVIMLSGIKKDTESRVKGLEVGADAFLSKPIDPSELAAQVNVMLRIKAAEDKLRDENKNLEELVEIRTNEALENELKFKTIVENAEGIIFLLNTDAKFLMAEGKKRAKLGFDQKNLIGKSALEIYKDQPEIIKSIKLAIKGEKSSCLIEFGELSFDAWFSPHYDGNKNVIGVIGVAVDISEMKSAEKKVKDALEKAQESDRLKSAFLATMSHELRTPLNAIIGFSEILNEELSPAEINEMSGIIYNNGSSLLEMVENIFDITLIESGEITITKENFEFKDFLDDLYVSIREEAAKLNKKHLKIILPDLEEMNEFSAFTDRRKLKQIIMNLVKNALKFTHDGSIKLDYTYELSDAGQSFLKIDVIDTGIGIENNKLDIIFKSFRQADETSLREYGGAGIGLSVAKKLSELIEGSLWVVSELNTGSTFSLKIPCSDTSKVKGNRLTLDFDQMKQSIGGNVILVVEDDISSYLLLKYLLKLVDVKSIWAKNGSEAIDYVQTVPTIKLVLMDLRMPGMTGYEAAHRIKSENPKLPIIAQTVQALYGEREKAIQAGCDDFVTKPIHKASLFSILEEYLK